MEPAGIAYTNRFRVVATKVARLRDYCALWRLRLLRSDGEWWRMTPRPGDMWPIALSQVEASATPALTDQFYGPADWDAGEVQFDLEQQAPTWLQPGDVLIFGQISWFGRASVAGYSMAVNADGETTRIDIHSINEAAESLATGEFDPWP